MKLPLPLNFRYSASSDTNFVKNTQLEFDAALLTSSAAANPAAATGGKQRDKTVALSDFSLRSPKVIIANLDDNSNSKLVFVTVVNKEINSAELLLRLIFKYREFF